MLEAILQALAPASNVAVIVGVIYWITRTRVSKNTCNVARNGQVRNIASLHNCIDTNIEVQNVRYRELREDNKTSFARLEKQISQIWKFLNAKANE